MALVGGAGARRPEEHYGYWTVATAVVTAIFPVWFLMVRVSV